MSPTMREDENDNLSAIGTRLTQDGSILDAGYPSDFTSLLQQSIDSAEPSALFVVTLSNLPMILSAYGNDTTERFIDDCIHACSNHLSEETQLHRLQKNSLGVLISGADQEQLNGLAYQLQSTIRQCGQEASYGSIFAQSEMVVMPIPESEAKATHVLDYCMQVRHGNHGIIQTEYTHAETHDAHGRQEMGLANYLVRAIEEDRLRMAYQPIIESKTGEVAHYEALLRIIGDDGSIGSAGPMIPLAERMGLIEELDVIVLRKVFEEVRKNPDIHLAFNVSNHTAEGDAWLNTLAELIKESPDVGQQLIVEITETALHDDLSRIAYFVANVQSHGLEVALDDFGSGYTSFRQLKTLSVDMVKIDGAFIKDLVDSKDNQFFVRTLLDFTKGFGLKSVAEFVENGETAKLLIELGVEYMQGYYFGKPENRRPWLADE